MDSYKSAKTLQSRFFQMIIGLKMRNFLFLLMA